MKRFLKKVVKRAIYGVRRTKTREEVLADCLDTILDIIVVIALIIWIIVSST